MLVTLTVVARDYKPEEIVNPNISDRRQYVADPGNLLSPGAREEANRRLAALRQETSAEVAVAIVPSIGDYTIEDFAGQLFANWGIGKGDKDNGVLIVIAPEQRRVRIHTGYGVEGVLPDISAKKIIDRTVVPHMREGDLDGAVTSVVEDVANVISDPVAAEELKSSQNDRWEQEESPITGEDFRLFIMWVALALFAVSLTLLATDSFKALGKDRYQKAMIWHDHRTIYWILAVCSLGLGIIPALIAGVLYKRARNKPLKCNVCGGKMHKLNEEEDNQLLSPAQDLEEKLNTVDYDVWVCDQCGSVEKYPFKVRQMKYDKCPNCGTISMREVQDHTLVPATTRHAGTGEKVFECLYCGHQRRKRYTIPKKEDHTAAALAAGAVIGSMGRGGGGGGSFGGGFGGGMSGGGGASGGW